MATAKQTEREKADAVARAYIDRVRNEPVWFAKEVLRLKSLPGEPTIFEDAERSWELDQFQQDILEACADVWRKKNKIKTRINHEGKRFITVRSGHGPGKTFTAAMCAHWFNSAFPGRVVCTAPKLAQIRTRLWSSLRKIDSRAEAFYRDGHVIHDTTAYWYGENSDGKRVELKNWCILGETATQPENLAGHHEAYQLVIVEEATGVTEDLWPVIFGALSSGVIQILLMISNPTKSTGTFASSHLQKREEQNYFRYHVNLKNARRINRSWVEDMERKYGKDSPVVAVRAHGEFPTNDPTQLLALEWITKAFEKDWYADGSLPRTVITVDVADGGVDESVITIAQHYQSNKRFRKQDAYNFPSALSPIMCADKAEQAWNDYDCSAQKGDYIVVDSLGVGAGTAGELMRRGYPVVRYVGGESSSNPERWRNRRVQSYIAFRNDLRDGQVSFDENFVSIEDYDDVIAQLCSIKIPPNMERVEDLVTKQKMKDDGVKSPDRADSIAMQYATQSPTVMTRSAEQRANIQTYIHSSTALDGL
jgi:phage terminase large subunit